MGQASLFIVSGLLIFIIGQNMALSARAQAIVDRITALSNNIQNNIAATEAAHDAANQAAEDADDGGIEGALTTLETAVGAPSTGSTAPNTLVPLPPPTVEQPPADPQPEPPANSGSDGTPAVDPSDSTSVQQPPN